MDVSTAIKQLVSAIREEVRAEVLTEYTEHMRRLVGGKGNGAKAKAARRAVRRNVPKTCIAPGCNEPSKGPRFHWLGDKHKGASKAEYTKWMKAWKEQNR